ncbi:MAG: glycosyltransferase family 39 protein [Anaerolineales bacterium]
MRPFNQFFATRWVEAVILLLILAFAAFTRFYQLDALPPGLYSDEAWYALDAVEVLNGARDLYFPANNGREPLFIYILAFSIKALGHTTLAVRLPAAVFGLANVLAAYGLGRALFNSRVGLLMAALTAGSFWALALSRIGLRATLIPALSGFMLTLAMMGWRTRRLWLLVCAGALCGLCFYTYLSARLIPLPFIAFGVWWYSFRRLGQGTSPTRLPWKSLTAFGLPAALVYAPLALFALREPQLYLGRVGQVSVLANGPAALFDNFIKVLAMFLFAGDMNARHNLPGRPVFDLALGLAFFAGLGLAFWGAWKKRNAACAFALLWCGTMLLPTLLSTEAPHFLRAIGALPMLLVFPALALEWLWNTGRWWRRAIVLLAVTAGALGAARDYFGPYALNPQLPFAFQSAAVELVGRVNEYEGPLYLDKRLWDFAAVRFLTRQSARPSPAVAVFEPGQPLELAPAQRIIFSPYTEYVNVLNALPPRSAITVEQGALFRNDGDSEPFPLYALFTVAPQLQGGPSGSASQPQTFERGIRLNAHSVTRSGAQIRVTLTWSVDVPLTDDVRAFIHLRKGDEVVIAQDDEALGSEYYPVRLWRSGDRVTRVHELALPADEAVDTMRLFAGLYLPSGERLKVNGVEDAIELTLP